MNSVDKDEFDKSDQNKVFECFGKIVPNEDSKENFNKDLPPRVFRTTVVPSTIENKNRFLNSSSFGRKCSFDL